MRIRATLAFSWALLLGAAAAAEPAVPVTVAEPAGVDRKAWPASGGIPFKKGQVKDVGELTLCDKDGKPVPAQFSKLAPYDDGSVQWALADFLVDLPAGGKAQFTVKAGKPAAPARALEIRETDDAVTVDTGAEKFAVNKARFSLLESAELGGRKVAGPGAVEITSSEGKSFKAGKPERASWEHRGPLRATLRVDGDYLDDAGAPYISYTARLTFWAGSAAVRVDHSLRNSNPKAGDDAKIREASVSLALGFPGADQGKGANWAACGDAGAGLLVADRHTGGCFPGGGRNAVHKVEAAGGKAAAWVVPPGVKGIGCGADFFALMDCAHKDSEVWLDFYPGGRDAKANEARAKGLLGKLQALADGAWISETEALGSGRFGTLQDEIETYKQWGWKGWDNPKKLPRAAYKPEAYVSDVAVHDESEADSAECLLLMYVRTGERGFFDDGEAWARYHKTHYAYRTDGFEYGRGRPNKGLKVDWYGPKEYGWGDSRAEKCHFYARGVLDYYCLTGDTDALEAGRDLLEQARAIAGATKPGGAIGYYGVRGFARMWLSPIRMAQLTADPKDRELADKFAEVALKASDWDARGFVQWGAGPAYMATQKKGWLAAASWPPAVREYMEKQGRTLNAKGEVVAKDGSWSVTSDGGTWQQAALAMALERYWRLAGKEEAKAKALKMAEFARDCQWSKKCEYVGYYTILDFPDKGKVYDLGEWDEAHKVCPGPGAVHNGHYTRHFPDVFARAYSLSGDKQWLEWAKRAWNRGSKRLYNTPKISAADDEVFTFAHHIPPKEDCSLTTCRMFYEVPRAK